MLDAAPMNARLMSDEQALAPEFGRQDVLHGFDASGASKTSSSIYHPTSEEARYRVRRDGRVTCEHQEDGFISRTRREQAAPALRKQRSKGDSATSRGTYKSSTMSSKQQMAGEGMCLARDDDVVGDGPRWCVDGGVGVGGAG